MVIFPEPSDPDGFVPYSPFVLFPLHEVDDITKANTVNNNMLLVIISLIISYLISPVTLHMLEIVIYSNDSILSVNHTSVDSEAYE